jgi:RNA polymerase sigma-70 factor (ECF subfamily)
VAELDLANLYARHRQGLYTHALLITRCAQRAEDAVHDAFARLCSRGDRRIADPVAYVFAAVRAAAIDQLRRARSDARAPAASIFAESSPDAAAMDAERASTVAAVLEQLPWELREVVVLKVYAGLTFAQLAEVTGEPLATVATRYRRTLERLRDRLEKLV